MFSNPIQGYSIFGHWLWEEIESKLIIYAKKYDIFFKQRFIPRV